MRPPDDDAVFETAMLSVKPEVLAFVAVSVKEPDVTETTAVPPVDSDAVNVAVYVVPEPESAESVPSVIVTSSRVNVEVDSLAVKVMVDVPPEETDVGLALITIVGAAVSYVMEVVLDAVFPFPTASENAPPAIEIEPVPDCVLAVGVKTAV